MRAGDDKQSPMAPVIASRVSARVISAEEYDVRMSLWIVDQKFHVKYVSDH